MYLDGCMWVWVYLRMWENSTHLLFLEGPRALQLTHVVPVVGLIIGRFHMLEQEHSTVQEMWSTRTRAPKILI